MCSSVCSDSALFPPLAASLARHTAMQPGCASSILANAAIMLVNSSSSGTHGSSIRRSRRRTAVAVSMQHPARALRIAVA